MIDQLTTNPTPKPLTSRRILSELLTENMAQSIVSGAILGALYASILMLIVSFSFPGVGGNILLIILIFLFTVLFAATLGFILGGVLGMILGALNGLITGILTLLAFTPLTNSKSYTMIIRAVTTLTSISSTLLIGWAIQAWAFPDSNGRGFMVWIALPIALIAGGGTFWTSGHTTRWYIHLNETSTHPTNNSSPTPTSRDNVPIESAP